MSTSPHLVQTTLAVAAATAAEVESRSSDVELICTDLLTSERPEYAHVAAICLSRSYLKRVTDPASVVETFFPAALDRFAPEVVMVGGSYLRAATLPESSSTKALLPTIVKAARELGELPALRGAVAASWWALLQSAGMRGTDPLSDVRRLCLELSSLESV